MNEQECIARESAHEICKYVPDCTTAEAKIICQHVQSALDRALDRALAAQAEQLAVLEKQRQAAIDGGDKHAQRADEAEEALRDICIASGGFDPSEGEGTSPQEVVELVDSKLTDLRTQLAAAKEEISILRQHRGKLTVIQHDLQEQIDKANAAAGERDSLLVKAFNIISEHGDITSENRAGWWMKDYDKLSAYPAGTSLLRDLEQLRAELADCNADRSNLNQQLLDHGIL